MGAVDKAKSYPESCPQLIHKWKTTNSFAFRRYPQVSQALLLLLKILL